MILLDPIPVTRHFVGRKKDLAYYRKQLDAHVVVIQGVGGIGKTALAAKLLAPLARQSRPVCWITLRAGLNTTWSAVLYIWAVFLAQHSQSHLLATWPDDSLALADRSRILRAALAAVRPVVCLDNLEVWPETDLPFWSLLDQIQQEACADLVLISQRRPPLSRLGDYPLLKGLPPAEAGRLLRRRGLKNLKPAQVESFTQYTQGNPRLLELGAARARQIPGGWESLAAALEHCEAVEHYLATEVIAALSNSEQSAAGLLALCRQPIDSACLQNPPNPSPLSEVDLEPRDFAALAAQGLVHTAPDGRWMLSPILRDPIQTLTRRRDMGPALQYCLAQLYALQGETLEMAYHLAQSGNAPQAVIALAEAKHRLIEHGQAYAMHSILADIQADRLDDATRQLLRILRSDLACLLGDYPAAEAEAALAAQEAAAPPAQAMAERRLGTVAKLRGNIPPAIDHYQRALQLLATEQATDLISLRRDLAWALMQHGDLNAARLEAQKVRIALGNTLGVIARRCGDFKQALEHLQTAAHVAQDIGDLRELMRVNNSLGRLYEEQGQLEQAITVYQDNLGVIETVGERVGQAATYLNIGVCHFKQHDYAAAIENETRALQVFEHLGDALGRLLAHTNLAEAQLELKQLTAARRHAEQAIQFSQMPAEDRAEAWRVYAEVLLAHSELDAARQAACTALDLAWPDQTREPPEPQLVALIQQTLARI
jgi:tetratricopeptide (TPR) repeat protein